MKKLCEILMFVMLVITLCIMGMVIYFSNYYECDLESLKYLESTDEVKVEYKNSIYYFDGYGEEKAIIFYPGAKVDARSYSKLMYKLASNGIDCFLVEMPFNFAFFGINRASYVIDNYKYDNYYMMGHSLGGVVAGMYEDDRIDGYIFLASYSTNKINKNVISIYGSEDKVLNREEYNNARDNYIGIYKELVIEGGNHAYFGNYGKQKGDGKAIISRNEQIDESVNYIINNLLTVG